jgi:hypothetical protein
VVVEGQAIDSDATNWAGNVPLGAHAGEMMKQPLSRRAPLARRTDTPERRHHLPGPELFAAWRPPTADIGSPLGSHAAYVVDEKRRLERLQGARAMLLHRSTTDIRLYRGSRDRSNLDGGLR